MNTDKTDFILLGSKHQLAKIQSQSIALDRGSPRSRVISSHLSLGPVWQFDLYLYFYVHLHGQGLARRFLSTGSYGLWGGRSQQIQPRLWFTQW